MLTLVETHHHGVGKTKTKSLQIIIPLDILPPHHIDREELAASVERSHRWEVRSLFEHLLDSRDRKQAIFCVIHGGTDVELRTKSLEYLTKLPWDGYAIGGSLGNGREELKTLLSWMMPLFNTTERRDKCRHLLGIADIGSIHSAVHHGLDTMDSSYPTKLARHGTLMTRDGLIRIKRGRHARSYGAKIDHDCECSTCAHYDRAYLCHLFKSNELLGQRLATVHNVHFVNRLMANMRADILQGKL